MKMRLYIAKSMFRKGVSRGKLLSIPRLYRIGIIPEKYCLVLKDVGNKKLV
jgi:hypothetical protein